MALWPYPDIIFMWLPDHPLTAPMGSPVVARGSSDELKKTQVALNESPDQYPNTTYIGRLVSIDINDRTQVHSACSLRSASVATCIIQVLTALDVS